MRKLLLALAFGCLALGCGNAEDLPEEEQQSVQSSEVGQVQQGVHPSQVTRCCITLFAPGPSRSQCITNGLQGRPPCGN
jgi:hypothetical protein